MQRAAWEALDQAGEGERLLVPHGAPCWSSPSLCLRRRGSAMSRSSIFLR